MIILNGFEKVREQFGVEFGYNVGRGVIGQQFERSIAESVRKQRLVLGEYLVDERNDLSFGVGDAIDEIEPLASKFA